MSHRYRCLYTDLVGDLFHYGHVRLLRQARAICDRLVVGVHNDADVAIYKRTPVMSMEERIEVLEACRYADLVVANAPLQATVATLESVGAEMLVHGDDLSSELLAFFYSDLIAKDRLLLLPYTPFIATSRIIERIAQRLADGTLDAGDGSATGKSGSDARKIP